MRAEPAITGEREHRRPLSEDLVTGAYDRSLYVTCTALLNSDVSRSGSVAVADRYMPLRFSGTFHTTEPLPEASVVIVSVTCRAVPCPYPVGSGAGLANSWMVNEVFGILLRLTRTDEPAT